jgi:peptide/nickel transport system substrate-binding protein
MAMASTLVAAACSSGSSANGDAGAAAPTATIGDEGTPVDGGSMTIGVNAESPGWNNHDSRWAYPASMVGSSVLEPLATIDKDLNPVPWLADSWTPSATYDSYTIKIHPNVTFQNGEKLDAAAVKLNIDDASTAALTSTAIKGLISQVSIIDETTVKVDLSQPWSAFPDTFLAGQPGLQMAPAMRRPNRGNDHRSDRSVHVPVVADRLTVQTVRTITTGEPVNPTSARSTSSSSATPLPRPLHCKPVTSTMVVQLECPAASSMSGGVSRS